LLQYIDGPNLRSWIEADNRRPLGTVIRILSGVVRALVAVHALGYGYGNLRPSNIMLSKNNEPFILPMGRRVAERRGRSVLDELESRSPDNEEIAYLTPEQFDEEHATVSAELSDQYMLGLLAFELITGKMPTAIGGEPPSPESLALIRTKGSSAFGALPLASDLRDGCPKELAKIIRRMTSLRPEKRYASLTELRAEVRRQEDIALTRVRESYKRCLAEQKRTKRSFFEAVYKIFFERRPDAQEKFQNLGPRQFEVLENAIVSLFAFYEQERVRQPNEPNVLTKTAQKHDRHNLQIGLDFYSPFVDSIIDTACGATGAEAFVFDKRCRGGNESARERMRSEWIEVLRPGVDYMKESY
jgi:serine/threonine protein kinase